MPPKYMNQVTITKLKYSYILDGVRYFIYCNLNNKERFEHRLCVTLELCEDDEEERNGEDI